MMNLSHYSFLSLEIRFLEKSDFLNSIIKFFRLTTVTTRIVYKKGLKNEHRSNPFLYVILVVIVWFRVLQKKLENSKT
jgi:hypothetical protein